MQVAEKKAQQQAQDLQDCRDSTPWAMVGSEVLMLCLYQSTNRFLMEGRFLVPPKVGVDE